MLPRSSVTITRTTQPTAVRHSAINRVAGNALYCSPAQVLKTARSARTFVKPRTQQIRQAAASIPDDASVDHDSLSKLHRGTWLWNKPPPKTSLRDVPAPPINGQAQIVDQTPNAAPWLLTLVEVLHFTWPIILCCAAWVIFDNASLIAGHLGGSSLRVFLLLLGWLCVAIGTPGAIMVHHRYEGWQYAPTQDPLNVPMDPLAYGNQWVRFIGFEVVFAFFALGLNLQNLAIFGFHTWSIALAIASIFSFFVGPREPRLAVPNPWYPNGCTMLPTPVVATLIYLVVNTVNFAGHVVLFGDVMARAATVWLPGIAANMPGLPVGAVLALLPPLITNMGAMWESMAETTYNQWDHLGGTAVMNVGYMLTLGLFWCLVHY